ncbi:MAG: hypothetical protein AUJ31_00790 [Parcubacteria group bacterium CG1_02_39_15]|uniref:Pilus assembly protein PilO n=3 Tax=Candidatus Nealsoniibacteriota TaxID=1817911 RepID=A0A2H0MNN0_9BACT|nr:MAG: hypothetical protein AUJ31_00790 [Parcubacteria group bacterium CG1_02_39_15]PIQ98259.1 MAG: hypothetical protein COV64_02335 [Candidatus Nealsonbacteria bacterium CG11_big_fil_rev_8_21_14_0_20_39_9]PIW90297.1 MAG: hypothetical protein COZ92_01160 [Candidatus Nealsonbacteria bacterium CG_4_8_14_3_um_filter_40_11]PIZ88173.1 MAG: hypothetical protein COX91_01580 [Candidatus Nealsonbacteria bacterium CG_4_10_14_0_2_um_filter_39_15]
MNRLVIIFISLFLALVWGVFFVVPKNGELTFLRKEIQERRAELQSKEAYFASLRQLSQRLEEYQTPLAKVESAIPDTPELPTLFDFVQQSVSQSGLVLKGLDVVTPVGITEAQKAASKSTPLKDTYLNLVLGGSYPAFKNFLSLLEKSSRFIEVELITFSTQETEEIGAKIRVKVHSL